MSNNLSRRIARKKAAKNRHIQEVKRVEESRDRERQHELYTALARELTVPTAPLPILHDHTKVPYVMGLLDNGITKLQQQGKLMLPKFAPQGTLSVFSDYGGDHQRSKFRTYSFFIAESGLFIKEFLRQVKRIRGKYGIPTGAEISYKELKPDSLVAKSIHEFTKAARNLFGIVLTLVVEKSLDSIFVPDSEGGLAKLHAELSMHGIRQFKPATLERLLRISYAFAYLLKLVANPSRKVLWLPDRDPTMVNERTMQEAVRLSNWCGLTLGDSPDRRIEVVGEEHIDHFADLMAVPDLIAGATSLLMTEREQSGSISKTGFESAMSLVDDQGLFLRNLFFCVRRGDDGQIIGEMVNFTLKRRQRNAVKILI